MPIDRYKQGIKMIDINKIINFQESFEQFGGLGLSSKFHFDSTSDSKV